MALTQLAKISLTHAHTDSTVRHGDPAEETATGRPHQCGPAGGLQSTGIGAISDRYSVGIDHFQEILGSVRFSVGGSFVVVSVDEVQASELI